MARKGDLDLAALGNLVNRLFPAADATFERTLTGVSTQVYRVRRRDEAFYLRLAEERAATLAPEVRVHALLRERGVNVPEVISFEPFDDALQRSVMVTTEIRGEPLSLRPHANSTTAILQDAGRDLAAINDVPVTRLWLDQARPRERQETGGRTQHVSGRCAGASRRRPPSARGSHAERG